MINVGSVGVKAHAAIILIYESGCDNIDECGSGSLEIIGERNVMPMKVSEIIALGNFLVNIIRLLFDILKNKKNNKKDRS